MSSKRHKINDQSRNVKRKLQQVKKVTPKVVQKTLAILDRDEEVMDFLEKVHDDDKEMVEFIANKSWELISKDERVREFMYLYTSTKFCQDFNKCLRRNLQLMSWSGRNYLEEYDEDIVWKFPTLGDGGYDEMIVYRGWDCSFFQEDDDGKYYHEKGIMSTTIDLEAAEVFIHGEECILEIVVPSDMPILFLHSPENDSQYYGKMTNVNPDHYLSMNRDKIMTKNIKLDSRLNAINRWSTEYEIILPRNVLLTVEHERPGNGLYKFVRCRAELVWPEEMDYEGVVNFGPRRLKQPAYTYTGTVSRPPRTRVEEFHEIDEDEFYPLPMKKESRR